MTHAAMVLAVATGSAPEVVGISVEPKTDTIREIPAAAYCDLIADLSELVSDAHSAA